MKHRHEKLSWCTNCGFAFAPDADNFCPRCGQENHERLLPLMHLLGEFFESILHFDSKVITTIGALLFQPGKLTAAFIEGKRVLYVSPLRLYVFVSFLFFLLLSVRSTPPTSSLEAQQGSSRTQFHISFLDIRADELRGIPERGADSVMFARGIERTTFNRYAVRQMIRIANEGYHTFLHSVIRNASYIMFLLMPLFALLMYFVERQARPYYVSCLVGSLHFHCFIFVVLFIEVVALMFFGSLVPFTVGLLLTFLYLYVMLKRLYHQGVAKTIAKTLAVGIVYIVLVLGCTILTIFVSVILY